MFRISSSRPHATGFTLIEVMLGMVIGMLGIIVMMQLYSVTEGQKRTTTGGDDAQNNGSIALFQLQRDVHLSGYGFSQYNMLGCSLTLRTGITIPVLAPVIINPPTTVIPAGDANTDTLLIAYGNSNGSPQGDGISSYDSTAVPAQYKVQTPLSFAVGDRVIALAVERSVDCGLTPLILDTIAPIPTLVPAIDPNTTVVVTSGAGAVVVNQTTPKGNALYNLGPGPTVRAYAIRNNNLTMCDYMISNCGSGLPADLANTAIWVPIASNAVSLRALYGQDTTDTVTPKMDGTVDQWSQTLQGLAVPACEWARISAVRIGIVMRVSQYEKKAQDGTAITTAAAPTWLGSGVAPFDLSKKPDGTVNADWQKYRYKMLQTTVPIRNMNWMGTPVAPAGATGTWQPSPAWGKDSKSC